MEKKICAGRSVLLFSFFSFFPHFNRWFLSCHSQNGIYWDFGVRFNHEVHWYKNVMMNRVNICWTNSGLNDMFDVEFAMRSALENWTNVCVCMLELRCRLRNWPFRIRNIHIHWWLSVYLEYFSNILRHLEINKRNTVLCWNKGFSCSSMHFIRKNLQVVKKRKYTGFSNENSAWAWVSTENEVSQWNESENKIEWSVRYRKNSWSKLSHKMSRVQHIHWINRIFIACNFKAELYMFKIDDD